MKTGLLEACGSYCDPVESGKKINGQRPAIPKSRKISDKIEQIEQAITRATALKDKAMAHQTT